MGFCNKITENFKRQIVDCINTVFQDTLPHYLLEYRPDTMNGLPHLIGDWINKSIRDKLTSNSVQVLEFSRYSWRGKVIVDRENFITYTIMRDKRLQQLRREKREKPHYLQSLVSILNKDLESPIKQITYLGNTDSFTEDILFNDYESILKGQVKSTDGFRHCVVLYDTDRGSLMNVTILLLDKNLDEVDKISLNDYIVPDFTKLTEMEYKSSQDELAEEKQSGNLVAIRFDKNSISKKND